MTIAPFTKTVYLHALIVYMSYDKVIAFDSLYKGLKASCRNIRWKDSTVGYETNILRNTYRLKQQLVSGRYKIDGYQRFRIYEPKQRDIVATRLKDRQFQHSLCDNGLYEQITRSFIKDNCACMRGRGVDYALDRMTSHLRRYYNKHGCDGWVLKCDIKHYFQNIRHDVAKQAIRKRALDPEMSYRTCEIIDSFGGDTGIGLGSQVSQLIALAVLDDFDHTVKERLRVKHYVRYMDDFILIHHDKEFLQRCWKEIAAELSKIGLELNSKTTLYPLRQGVKFLQWRFIVTKSGAIIRKFAKKKQSKQRKKLTKLHEGEVQGRYAPGTTYESHISWLANAQRGDTYYECNKMDEFYKGLETLEYG